VRSDAVWPETLAGERPPAPHMLGHPGQRSMRYADLRNALLAAPLRFLEGLEQVHGDPAVALVHGPAQHHHVHDGKDARLAEIIRFDLLIIGEQPLATRVARRDCRVELAPRQHLAERALGHRDYFYSLGQRQLDFLDAA